jgi:hypothetical protein
MSMMFYQALDQASDVDKRRFKDAVRELIQPPPKTQAERDRLAMALAAIQSTDDYSPDVNEWAVAVMDALLQRYAEFAPGQT